MVKKGYKQTEMGILPMDWKVMRIGDFSSPVRGGSPRPAGDKRYFNGQYIPWLTVAALTNIATTQMYVSETETCLTEEGSKYSRFLSKETLIIANSGATLGVAKLLAIECCANDGIAALQDINTQYNKKYIVQYINSKTEYLRNVVATGNGQPNLNTTLIADIKIPFPTKVEEQTAIATALSDADNLICSLEKLIEKKRMIKQGTMQELLKPKKKWKSYKISNLATMNARIGWQGLKTSEYRNTGDYLLITGTEFLNGYIDWKNCFYVDYERYKQDRNIQIRPNDVLITKDGTIGKVAFIKELFKPATLNSGVFVIRANTQLVVAKFLYYLLLSEQFSTFLLRLSAGSTINHLYQKDFVQFTLKAPSVDKQEFIADTLSNIDEELIALENKLAKYRQIKQGMMQELLTGRIRLYERGATGKGNTRSNH